MKHKKLIKYINKQIKAHKELIKQYKSCTDRIYVDKQEYTILILTNLRDYLIYRRRNE